LSAVAFHIDDVTVREMRSTEFAVMRETSTAAFDDPSIATLIDELKASWAWDDRLSFVAVLGDQIVGQVLYTHAILDAPDRLVDVAVLSPIGVAPRVQRKGIGLRLISETMPVLDAAGVPVVFLEGNPRYYERSGFEQAIPHGFRKPSERIPDVAFQFRRLSRFDPAWRGTLVYPDAFWRTDSVGLR
jgi:putative acetyltransferase